MANVKEIVIFGKIPFNCNEHAEMNAILGDLNAPTIGLRINYGKQSLGPPNDHGGRTTFYEYSIEGQEAVSHPYIERMLQAIVDCGGTVEGASVVDIENSEKNKVTIPKPRKGVFTARFEIKVGPDTNPDTAAFHLREYAKGVVTTGYDRGPRPNKALGDVKVEFNNVRVEPS